MYGSHRRVRWLLRLIALKRILLSLAVRELLEADKYDEALEKIEAIVRQAPSQPFVVSLKAYILLRCGRPAEAVRVAAQAKALDPVDLGSLHNLAAIFRGAGRASDAIELFERAFQRSPGNDELAQKYMHLLIKEHRFKPLQAVALKLYRQSKAPQLRFWVVMCLILQAEAVRDEDPEAFQKDISYTLAERYLLKAREERLIKGYEELYLCYLVYMGMGKLREALELLDGPLAQTSKIAPKLRDLRLELLEKLGEHARAREIATQILMGDLDNWAAYLVYIDATLKLGGEAQDDPRTEGMAEARLFLNTLSVKSAGLSSPKRGPFLAELELAAKHREPVLPLITGYLDRFGAKACAFEDLVPYLNHLAYDGLDGNGKGQLWDHIQLHLATTKVVAKGLSQSDAVRNTVILANLLKVERFLASALPDAPTLNLQQKADTLMELYSQALPLGKPLERTEKQYGDDFALLAAHYLLDAPNENAFQASLLLEYAIGKSPHNFHLKFLLVRVYHLLGAYQRPCAIYASLDVKHVQLDTLSHLVVDAGAALGHFTQTLLACHNALTIYSRNRAETPEMIVKAFQHNTFSKIREFIEFQGRLEGSLQRRITGLELLRCELAAAKSLPAYGGLLASIPDADLAAPPGRLYDQRDFDVLLSFTPARSPQRSVEHLTRLLPRRSPGWVKVTAHQYKMLKALFGSDGPPAEVETLLADFATLAKDDGLSPLEARLLTAVPLLLTVSQFVSGAAEILDLAELDQLASTLEAATRDMESRMRAGCTGSLIYDLSTCIEALASVTFFYLWLGSPTRQPLPADPSRATKAAQLLKSRILDAFVGRLSELVAAVATSEAPQCELDPRWLNALPEADKASRPCGLLAGGRRPAPIPPNPLTDLKLDGSHPSQVGAPYPSRRIGLTPVA
ncbi:mitochondrial distribution and morphology [Massospora cicadina]|nr:mitochondrial distribution and morphology [Massospora cicadina]